MRYLTRRLEYRSQVFELDRYIAHADVGSVLLQVFATTPTKSPHEEYVQKQKMQRHVLRRVPIHDDPLGKSRVLGSVARVEAILKYRNSTPLFWILEFTIHSKSFTVWVDPQLTHA